MKLNEPIPSGRSRLVIALVAFAMTLWIVPTVFAFTIGRLFDGNVTLLLALVIGGVAAVLVLMRLLRLGVFRQ